MSIYVDSNSYVNFSDNENFQKGLEEALEEQEKFAEVLERYDALQETPEERAARNKAEAQAARDRREFQTKLNELQGLIAELKRKLINSGYSDDVQAELSAAQSKLYWLVVGLHV